MRVAFVFMVFMPFGALNYPDPDCNFVAVTYCLPQCEVWGDAGPRYSESPSRAFLNDFLCGEGPSTKGPGPCSVLKWKFTPGPHNVIVSREVDSPPLKKAICMVASRKCRP